MSGLMAADDNARGVLWMAGAVLSFAAMAIGVRELLRAMEPFEVLFIRSVGMLAIVLALLPRAGLAPLATRHFRLHLGRNLFHFGGQWSWIYAIGALPLATVFAIEFTMPVWTALLAFFFLKEKLRFPRLVMLACGIVGVLVILRPGSAPLEPAAFVMLAGAFGYAAQMIYTKRLAATDAPLAVLFWMPVLQAPLSLVAALPGWVAPRLADAPWMVLLGAGSYTAHYCMMRAMKVADATVVVPVDFARLPLIAVVGALFYGEAFDPLVLIGAAVIFAGTYYSLSRERHR
jgi:drug/metabolite transporter (DMT)-like permease